MAPRWKLQISRLGSVLKHFVHPATFAEASAAQRLIEQEDADGMHFRITSGETDFLVDAWFVRREFEGAAWSPILFATQESESDAFDWASTQKSYGTIWRVVNEGVDAGMPDALLDSRWLGRKSCSYDMTYLPERLRVVVIPHMKEPAQTSWCLCDKATQLPLAWFANYAAANASRTEDSVVLGTSFD